jgi:predicted phage tail protein
MNEVVLHGSLAEEFGGPYMIDASSTIDAIRCLNGNFPEFKRRIRDGSWIVKRVFKGHVIDCDTDMLTFEMANAPIHIYPAVGGSGGHGGGMEKIILGVVLIGASLLIPGIGAFGAASMGSPVFGLTIGGHALMTYGTLGLLGVGLALGGLSMMISPGPSHNHDSSIGAAPQVSKEGDAVPLVFGRFMANGGVVASQSITNEVQVGDSNYQWSEQGGTNPVYVAGNTSDYQPVYSG